MDLKRIGTGRLADVFAWRDGLALKLYRSADHNQIAQREAAATEAVHAAGVPAARCHGTVEIDGRIGLILDLLPGPLMADVILTDTDAAITALADLHARIHDRTAIGFASIKEALRDRIERAVPAEAQASVLQRLAELPDGDSILHSDLHVANAMLDGDSRWVAIDWNVATTGPHHYGVARTLFLLVEADLGDFGPAVGVTGARARMGRDYLVQYEARRPLDRDQLAAWRLPVLAARLAEPIEAERDYLLAEIAHEVDRS
ncbi:MAG: phosphotransferase [Acidimicrobiia bacterium]|nr:phosphotransferase [Acidimicrobiia bacterium]